MTRDEAIAALHQCNTCRRWITTGDCDSCRVDRLPDPSPAVALAALNEAIAVGQRAIELKSRLRALLAESAA